MKTQKIRFFMLACMVAALVPFTGSAKTIELSLHHHDPVTASQGLFFDEFAAKVAEKSGGRLKVNVFHGGTLGGPKDTYDMVLNGTCDIGGGLQSFFPGRFPMTEAVTLPMMGVGTSVQGTKALMDLYTNTDYLKPEYGKFKVLLLNTMNYSCFAFKSKKVMKVSDIKDLKLRVNAGPPTDYVFALKATPVAIVIGELYSSIEKGVIDGVITDWNAFNSFKLYDQLRYYVDEYVTINAYFVLMNQKKYDSLPADLKKVIDECSGKNAIAGMSSRFDKVTADVKKVIKAKNGDIYTISKAEHNKLVALAKVVQTNWIKAMESKGLPAKKTVDAFAKLVNKYKNTK